MNRLTWVETPQGWRSGRYQIELLGPRTWVLSTSPAESNVIVALFQTPTLQEAKRAAQALEDRDSRTQLLWRQAMGVLAAATLFVIAYIAPGVWTIPMILVGTCVGLRSLVSLADSITGGAWDHLRDGYQ